MHKHRLIRFHNFRSLLKKLSYNLISISEIFLIFPGMVLIAFCLWMLIDCINRPDEGFAFSGKNVTAR